MVMNGLGRARIEESQRARVQEVTGQTRQTGAAVEQVPGKRVADRCQVGPNLMTPRTVGSYLHQGEIAARIHVYDIGFGRLGVLYLRSRA